MALRKTITMDNDVEIVNAYFKILTTLIDWRYNTISINLGCWKNKNACDKNKAQLPFAGLSFTLDISGEENWLTKAAQYALLKSKVAFFANAEDEI